MRNHSSEEKANETATSSLDPRRTEILAYEFWRARGCPEGSAEEQLRHQRNFTSAQAA
jgi:hypothetical protein